MWPWLLGSAGLGAALGGIQGYRQSGGDLGATLQSALGGGLTGGLTAGLGMGAQRMAGQAIQSALAGGAGARIAPEVFKASEAVGALRSGGGLSGARQALTQAGLQAPLAQQMQGLDVLGKFAPKAGGLAAGLALPLVASPLIDAVGGTAAKAAGGLVEGVGGVAKGVTGAALGSRRDGSEMTQPQYTAGTGLDPNRYLMGAFDANNPIGAMQASLGLIGQMDRQRMQLANQYQNFALQAGDTAKSRDLQRNAAMAALKTQLGTQQSLIVNGQQQGASMANQAIADTGALARTQFSY